MDELITLLIFGAIAAISTWITKKRQERAEKEKPFTTPSQTDSPPPRRRVINWEEEMRRLLEGETPNAPPSVPPSPINRPHLPAPQVRPSPVARPISPPVISTPPAPALWMVPEPPAPSTATLLQQVKTQQDEARQKIAQAQEKLRAVLQHGHPTRAHASISADRVRKILHNRESLRSAFVVSLVFGPPKSLADQ